MTRTQESTAGSGAAAARGGAFDATAPGEGDGASGRAPAHGAAGLQGRHVCPFCGSVNDAIEGPCPRCTMENTAETRRATKSRIGPWYVLQSRNPAAPGMTHDTLLGFVRKGRVKARSIVRGPTTHQLWRFACQVRGLSREFGVCYSCGGVIARDTRLCPQCNRPQDPPADPDVFLEGQPTSGGVVAATAPVAPVAVNEAPAAALAPVAAKPAVGLTSESPVPSGAEAGTAGEPRPAVYRELKVSPVAVGDDIVVPPLAAGVRPGAAPVPATPLSVPPPPEARAATPPAPVTVPEPSALPAPDTREDWQEQPAPAAGPVPSPAPASAGGTPGQRKAKDVFLSAKDLAAAFQLDFKPDADVGTGAADAAYSRSVAAAGADTALPWPPRRRRKRGVGRTLLMLLLLAACGFGAALALSPTLRQQTIDWANSKYQSLTGANLYPDIASRPRATTAPVAPAAPQPSGQRQPTSTSTSTTPTRGATAPAVAGRAAATGSGSKAPGEVTAGARATTQQTPAERPPEPQRQAVRSGPERASAQPSSDALDVSRQSPPAAPSPAVTKQSPPASAPRPVVVATQPARAAVAAPTPAPPAPAPKPKLTLQEAQQKAKAWYGQALDADAEGDLAKATQLYKRIMDELPAKIDGQDVWPSDVKLRHDEAVKILGAK